MEGAGWDSGEFKTLLGKRKPEVGGLFFFFPFCFFFLRPLRFPPVLTRLRLYNSPERVTSSRVEIPGLFLFYPFSFFSSLLLEGWGGGRSYCGTFVKKPVAEAGPTGDLWQHLQDAKPSRMLLIIQRALAGFEIEKRWSDGV